MSGARNTKTRTAIPEYVKRAVIARDGNKCRNCGVETEFLHWDHLFPFDLGWTEHYREHSATMPNL